MALSFTNTIYVGKATPSSGGGTAYTAGDGIVISGGTIKVADTALQDVPQVISSGYVASSVSPNGGYFLITGSAATMGASGTYKVSVGASTATVKTNTSTGLYLNGTTVNLLANGASRFTASGSVTNIYGTTTAGGIRIYAYGNSGTVKVKSNNGNYDDIITESHYATSSAPGIVQPDNSTCTVDSGGILSITPPTTLWASGNAGSEITYSALDGASVLRAYKNGLLMESGADYVIGSSGVVSYTTPLESSDKAAFEYYPAAPTRNIVPDGGKGLRSSEPEDYIIDDGEEENKGEER